MLERIYNIPEAIAIYYEDILYHTFLPILRRGIFANITSSRKIVFGEMCIRMVSAIPYGHKRIVSVS